MTRSRHVPASIHPGLGLAASGQPVSGPEEAPKPSHKSHSGPPHAILGSARVQDQFTLFLDPVALAKAAQDSSPKGALSA